MCVCESDVKPKPDIQKLSKRPICHVQTDTRTHLQDILSNIGLVCHMTPTSETSCGFNVAADLCMSQIYCDMISQIYSAA